MMSVHRRKPLIPFCSPKDFVQSKAFFSLFVSLTASTKFRVIRILSIIVSYVPPHTCFYTFASENFAVFDRPTLESFFIACRGDSGYDPEVDL
jgi:hypothetical protein